jgi:hypothetical protein
MADPVSNVAVPDRSSKLSFHHQAKPTDSTHCFLAKLFTAPLIAPQQIES